MGGPGIYYRADCLEFKSSRRLVGMGEVGERERERERGGGESGIYNLSLSLCYIILCYHNRKNQIDQTCMHFETEINYSQVNSDQSFY